MRDVVFEWYVPYFPDKRKMLIKAVMISAALVFFIDAVFFAAGMLISFRDSGGGRFLPFQELEV